MEFKRVPGFEDYECSKCGQIRSKKTGKVLKHQKKPNGYMQVNLYRDKKQNHIGVHRVVGMSWLGQPPGFEELHIAHYDGDKTNNVLENLRWATASENEADKKRHGTRNSCEGMTHPNRKLTTGVVDELRQMARGGMNCKQISEARSIPKLTVYDAVTGITWKNAHEPPVSLKGRQNSGVRKSKS